tara:strand:- start:5477 stop:7621 length:2145 start_codon:yes stop_codon:yes gene_type:complete
MGMGFKESFFRDQDERDKYNKHKERYLKAAEEDGEIKNEADKKSATDDFNMFYNEKKLKLNKERDDELDTDLQGTFEKGEALGRGVMKPVSGEFFDEQVARVKASAAPLEKFSDDVTQKGFISAVKDIPERYSEYSESLPDHKNIQRKRTAMLADKYPVIDLVGQTAGAIGMAYLISRSTKNPGPGMAFAKGQLGPILARTATQYKKVSPRLKGPIEKLGKKILKENPEMAKAIAAGGYLGAGMSDKDITDPEILPDIAKGAAGGYLVQKGGQAVVDKFGDKIAGAAESIPPKIEKIRDYVKGPLKEGLSTFSDKQVLKQAMGPGVANIRKAIKSNKNSPREPGHLDQTIGTLATKLRNEKNELGQPIIRMGNSLDGVQSELEKNTFKRAKEISIINADDIGQKGAKDKQHLSIDWQFSNARQARKIKFQEYPVSRDYFKSNIMAPLNKKIRELEGQGKRNVAQNKMVEKLKDLKARYKENYIDSDDRGFNFRELLDERAGYIYDPKESDTIQSKINNELYMIFTKAIRNRVKEISEDENLIKQLKKGFLKKDEGEVDEFIELASRYNDNMDKYHDFIEVIKAGNRRLEQDLSNRFISPSDYISGATGAIAGGPVAGGSLAATNFLGRRYGNSVSAELSKKIINMIENEPEKISKYPRLTKILEQSKQNKEGAFNVAGFLAIHKMLEKTDPDYQRMWTDFKDDEINDPKIKKGL